MNTVDLNELREQILRNQARGTPLPRAEEDKVLVDHDGRIVRGRDADDHDNRTLSEVHQGVFAGLDARLARDAQVVADRLPEDSRQLTVDGVTGWLYRIVSELGDPYDLFVYFDGAQYQVKVVSPEVEGRYEPHRGHLYRDGRICPRSEGGMPDLDGAYAKSVLWATGFSTFLRTGVFPFNL